MRQGRDGPRFYRFKGYQVRLNKLLNDYFQSHDCGDFLNCAGWCKTANGLEMNIDGSLFGKSAYKAQPGSQRVVRNDSVHSIR
jgi:hypothetical protein